MKTTVILFCYLFILLLTNPLYSQVIDQLNSVTLNRKIAEFTPAYISSVWHYENRIIVNTFITTEEYLMNQDGGLERVLFYEHPFFNYSRGQLVDHKYYTYSGNKLLIFNLTSLPMQLEETIDLPAWDFKQLHVVGDYIFIFLFGDIAPVIVFNQRTNQWETTLYDLSDMFIFEHYIVIPTLDDSMGIIELAFYDSNSINEQYPFGDLVHSFSLDLDIEIDDDVYYRVEDSLLYVLGKGWVNIYDLNNLDQIIEMHRFYLDVNQETVEYQYLDALLYENYLLAYHRKGFLVYDISNSSAASITFERKWNNTPVFFHQLLVIDQRLYLSAFYHLDVYDLSNNMTLLGYYGKSLATTAWSLDPFYLIERSIHTSEVKLTPILNDENQSLVLDTQSAPGSVSLNYIHFHEQYLFTLYRSATSNWIGIYELPSNQLLHRYPLDGEPIEGEPTILTGFDDVLFIDDVEGFINRKISQHVYRFSNGELNYLGKIPDSILLNTENYSLEGYILTYHLLTNRIDFRPQNDPLSVVSSIQAPLSSIDYLSSLLSSNVFALKHEENIYFYHFDDNFSNIQLLESLEVFPYSPRFRNDYLCLSRSYDLSLSNLIYRVHDGLPVKIGEFEQLSDVSVSAIYPNEKKIFTLGTTSVIEYDIEYTTVSEANKTINPLKTQLLNNYPNPFNPETTISFFIAQTGFVTLSIFNIKGQKIKTLISEQREVGNHQVIWNGTNDNQHAVSSGFYFYQLSTQEYTSTKKMVLLK